MPEENAMLVVGGDSAIGAALVATMRADGDTVMTTTRHRDCVSEQSVYLDLAEDQAGWRAPQTVNCAVICAAVTSIATCEQFPSDTRAVNVTNTIALCHSLIERRIFVVFISTNQVFDGSVPIRDAADEACPVSEYGKQKAAVEAYLAEHKNTSAILRLSKVLGRNSEIFRDWAAALGRRTPIFPAADMVISPIRLETCISAIMSIAAARVPRVFQLSGTDDIGYAEIARRIAKKVQAEPSLVVPRPGADLGIDAKFRPSHTTLDTRRLREDFGYPPIDSRQVIEHEVDLAIEGLSKT